MVVTATVAAVSLTAVAAAASSLDVAAGHRNDNHLGLKC